MAMHDDDSDRSENVEDEFDDDEIVGGIIVRPGADEAYECWEKAIAEIVNARVDQLDPFEIADLEQTAVDGYKTFLTYVVDDRVKRIVDEQIRELVKEKVDEALLGGSSD